MTIPDRDKQHRKIIAECRAAEPTAYDRRADLGDALADMALLVGCTRTFEYNYLKRKLVALDAEGGGS